ncbi:MAG: CBS domain-containing protein [Anaerolineaceae bacterium]|nr:CBS domain-containing protein [Anaerolineaceae bacterium]
MRISDCMITTVYTIHEEALLGEAMQTIADHLIAILPVVNGQHQLAGILVLDDILSFFMPHFVKLLRSADFIHDYGILETGRKRPHLAKRQCREVMRQPYCVEESSGLMPAMVLMHKHHVSDIPVVNAEKQVVGLVSRGRVGSLFLRDWLEHFEERTTDAPHE